MDRRSGVGELGGKEESEGNGRWGGDRDHPPGPGKERVPYGPDSWAATHRPGDEAPRVQVRLGQGRTRGDVERDTGTGTGGSETRIQGTDRERPRT